MLTTASDQYDVIEAMKLQRMRLAKDQGLRPWTPGFQRRSADAFERSTVPAQTGVDR